MQASVTWLPLVVLGATFASAGIVLMLCRLRLHTLPAALIGGLTPGVTIFAICAYLDSRLAEGVFYLWFGGALGLFAVIFGLAAAAVTAILFAKLSDRAPDSHRPSILSRHWLEPGS